MKLYPILFLAVLAIGVASADVSIVNDTFFNLGNSAYLNVLAPQTTTNITIYNSTSTPASALQFYINGTPIRFTANTNKTLSNIFYNNVTDIVTYTGNGTTGYLNVSARMNLSLRYYDFEVDGIINQALLSDASGWVTFNYTGWIQPQHDFRIKRTGAPSITFWGNNKTNDQSTTLTINISEAVNFNATANQSIDTWYWFKDDADQSNNDVNFITNFTAGTHTIRVNATNNANGTSNTITWTVTVVAPPTPAITSFAPPSPANDIVGAARTFNITVNQTVDVRWYINGTLKQTDTGVTASSYTNTSAAPGTWNVTATANNANGTDSQQWTWNVTATPTGAPNITSFAPSSPVSDIAGATRTFNITINQTVDVRWYINGTLKQTDTGVTVSSYTNTSAAPGTWNVTATANNANGTISQQWIWNVTAAPTGAPNITSFAPPSPVSNSAGATRTFNITINQTVNVTWYINGTTIFNQTNVTASSYTNTSAAPGTWNVTATANNANGVVSQQWIWNVTAAMVINITSPASNSVNDTGYVNVTVTLNTPGTAFLNWEGANESMNGAGTNFYKNKTGLLSGNFTFKIYANDSGGLSNVSETRVVTVDRTTIINLSAYIDPVTGNVTQILNLPAPSRNSTLTIFNGTNATLNGAPIRNITIDSLAQVNSTYTAYLNSSDKLIGENLSCGPNGVQFRPDIQIRLNYTDAQLTAAGINASTLRVKFYNTTTNTWIEQTPYTLNETGKYIIANVSHFTTFALIGTAAAPVPTPVPTAPPVPVSVPGGGGGAGAISPEPLNNIDMFEIAEEYLGANVPASYIFATPNLVISEVLITPAKNFGTTSIRVEMLKDLSKIEGVTQPLGTVYKYANIWVGAKELEREQDIIDAFIGFRVERGWLAENNLEAGSIRLLRWDGSKWDSLATEQKSLDEQFVYYVAKTYAFSPFAIVANPPYPSATIRPVETPTLIIPFQRILESKIAMWVYILIALAFISFILYKSGMYKKALKVYGKVTEIKQKAKTEEITPGDSDAWYNRGFDLYEQGKYDEAIKAYDKAIDIIHKSEKEKKD